MQESFEKVKFMVTNVLVIKHGSITSLQMASTYAWSALIVYYNHTKIKG